MESYSLMCVNAKFMDAILNGVAIFYKYANVYDLSLVTISFLMNTSLPMEQYL